MSGAEAGKTAISTKAAITKAAGTAGQAPTNPAPLSAVPSIPAQSAPTDPELCWRHAARALLARTIAEFAHEGLLAPVAQDDGWHLLSLERPGSEQSVEYRFRADRGAYDSWFVDPGSVRRAGHPAADPLAFAADAAPTLGLSGESAGHLVRELAATLAADAQILATATLTAAELADLDHAELEGHQTGHPWIAFNKGRLGFSAADTLRYAPEARQPVCLPWIAVRDDLARYQALPGLSARRLYTEELSPAARVRFGAELIRRGCNPARYWWLPIHPWQWDEAIQLLYGAEIAASRVVYLGEGDDSYLAQQPIRTFGNITVPHRRDVKLPLSILNTAAWHGLPPERTLTAPAVTSWLQCVAAADPFLSDECKVILLGEVASVTVGDPVLDRIDAVPYQYRELLGAIWREPLSAALHPGERARTLAALLSFGADGSPLIAELVARSGLEPGPWLDRLLAAILPPLLRFLYAHGTAFAAHGENTVVIYDEHDVPTRLALRDFADDLSLAAAAVPELAEIPEQIASVLPREKPDQLCQSLHDGLFVGHFRYLSRICERHLDVPPADFWAMVRAAIRGYQEQFPEHAERYALFDLSASHIGRRRPNRGSLLPDAHRDRAERARAEAHGVLPNPLSTVG
jgi:siderophore synthetase component